MVECKIDIDGNKSWRNIYGKRHREDGPAIEFVDGTKSWWINGKRHRENGPAIEYANGTKSWWINGKLHREDGPAIEYGGNNKLWYLNNEHLSFNDYCIKLYGVLDHPKSIMLQVKYG